MVEACNPKATANALAAILLDDEMRARMGQVMRRRIPNLYNKNRVRQLYKDLYAPHKDLDAPPPSAPGSLSGLTLP